MNVKTKMARPESSAKVSTSCTFCLASTLARPWSSLQCFELVLCIGQDFVQGFFLKRKIDVAMGGWLFEHCGVKAFSELVQHLDLLAEDISDDVNFFIRGI